MKNFRLPLIAIAGILLFTACNNKADFSKARVKKTSSVRGSTEYTYGADGNITTTKSSDGTFISYKYSGSTIAENMADSSRNLFINSTIYLNSSGLADSTVSNYQDEKYLKTYTHNAGGFITESRDYAMGQMQDLSSSEVKDGNQTTATISDSASKPMFKVFFEYFQDKPNSVNYENYGMKFLGADSKNLIKKMVQLLPTGDTLRVNSFSYHYDDKGRVTSKITFDMKRGIVADSTAYSYTE
jgi:YD repeat-containing protein